jgi:predicted TPR repeat methyltransferase
LCYFGELDGATRASAKALRPGGWLIYTVEALPANTTEGYRITTSGRYAHGRGYVESSLREAGFEVASIDAVVLRMEAGIPVDGWLVTGRKV